ncbi:MAG: hypothetical protein BGN86_12275 [Caulobacterales bacterium 68-7]|nr:MAG: hypothetical protein BGN86_12275 [Caulobacterales bacterium 68-7]
MFVDPDEDALRANKVAAELYGFQVEAAQDPQAASHVLRHRSVDVAVVDGADRYEGGLGQLRALHPSGHGLIIIAAAVSADPGAAITAFEQGADAFVVKPYAATAMIARIRAMLRRRDLTARVRAPAALELSFDAVSGVLNSATERVTLTSIEGRLLWSLLSRPDQAFSRHEISEVVGGDAVRSDLRSTDQMISRLREKLGRLKARNLILTRRKAGYALRDDLQVHFDPGGSAVKFRSTS